MIVVRSVDELMATAPEPSPKTLEIIRRVLDQNRRSEVGHRR